MADNEVIAESHLVQVGATPDGEFVLLRWGDPKGERHSFEVTYGRFQMAMQQLNELSARLVAQKQAIGGLELAVPLALEVAQATASLGGEVVLLDFSAEGSLGTVSYHLTSVQAERLAAQLLAAAASAKTQRGEQRH